MCPAAPGSTPHTASRPAAGIACAQAARQLQGFPGKVPPPSPVPVLLPGREGDVLSPCLVLFTLFSTWCCGRAGPLPPECPHLCCPRGGAGAAARLLRAERGLVRGARRGGPGLALRGHQDARTHLAHLCSSVVYLALSFGYVYRHIRGGGRTDILIYTYVISIIII